VTGGALALAFFDHSREIYGTARTGATLLFRGRSAEVLAAAPEVSEEAELRTVRVEDRVALEFEPAQGEVDLGAVSAQVARVTGEVDGVPIEGVGTLSETRQAPAWEELDALRTISALIEDGDAMLALARRPRGASGHGHELVAAGLLHEGETMAVEETRISTVYDSEGRQRSAGLELWLPGEEFPRRGSGVAVAGSSLELEGLYVHAAVFRWRLDGREGIGAYELMVRQEEPRAA